MGERLAPPRGTQDVLPEDSRLRELVLQVAAERLRRAGFGQVATPTFEHTELFARGVGEHTDVVAKEMYTFADRGGRSLTLRPEGTAPVARAFISHGMHKWPQPVKLWYAAPMFRYEAPQKGRYREHWQVGAECFGDPSPTADAELIATLAATYSDLGLRGTRLRLNTIGDASTRPAYRELLLAYLAPHAAELADDDRRRLNDNPLRLFDSKHQRTRELLADAPKVREHVSPDCGEHFAQVRALLDAAGVAYEVDDTLVRGFDYYTHTTFEFTAPGMGAQDAIGGGGRYDGLVGQLGGPATPGVGFGCGVERLVLALQAAGIELPAERVHAYVGAEPGAPAGAAFALACQLRDLGLRCELDGAGRSRNGRFKQAQRLGARLLVGIEDDGSVLVRDLEQRDEQSVTAADAAATIAARLEER